MKQPKFADDGELIGEEDIETESERQDKIIEAEEENRLREATAIQVYPMFLSMFTHAKKSPINGQVQGVNIDVVQAATMAWQAAEALTTVGKMSNKGRAFVSDQTKQPEPKGILQ